MMRVVKREIFLVCADHHRPAAFAFPPHSSQAVRSDRGVCREFIVISNRQNGRSTVETKSERKAIIPKHTIYLNYNFNGRARATRNNSANGAHTNKKQNLGLLCTAVINSNTNLCSKDAREWPTCQQQCKIIKFLFIPGFQCSTAAAVVAVHLGLRRLSARL